ncbi:MAG TPA: EamA family transporter [Propionibacterium sp.]|nr:EamA family transporter [Propionibacterium sp.]
MTHPRTGLGWLVLAGVTWGTSGTLGVLLRAESGLSLLPAGGYRILVGGMLILGFVLLTGRLRLPTTASAWRRVAALGLASGLYQVTFFSSIGYVGIAVTTLVTIGSTPVMVLAVEALTGRVRLTGRLALALAAALVGLVLLAGSPPEGIALGDALIGAGLSLVAGASFAAISLLGANPDPGFDDATGTGLAFVGGGLVILAVASLFGPIGFAVTPLALVWVVALGLVPSAVAYLSYLRGLRTQSGTTGSLVALLEPLTATTLAAIVFREWLTPVAALGAGLLLAAVVLTTIGPRSGVPRDTMEPELHP